MEILFVSHKYPPSIGGMQKQSFELITGMEKFASVHRLTLENGQNRLVFLISLKERIQRILRTHPGITIVHFNDALVASVCLHHTYCKNVKRVVTVHGLDIVFPSRIYQNIIFPRFNRFDLLIAVSQATAVECIKRGIEPSKVITINNGVDPGPGRAYPRENLLKSFKERNSIDLTEKKVLTCLGRPVKRKGFSWFLKHVLPNLDGNFILLLAGPFDSRRSLADFLWSTLPGWLRKTPELILGYPSDENEIRMLLKSPELQGKAMHLGRLDQSELSQLLSLSDAFIMPNIQVKGDMEGFGLVCLEASLGGSWVFASALQGITSAVHEGKNGTLLPASQHHNWIATLNKFIENPLAFPTAESSRAYTTENFSWHKMAYQYYQEFLSLQDKK